MAQGTSTMSPGHFWFLAAPLVLMVVVVVVATVVVVVVRRPRHHPHSPPRPALLPLLSCRRPLSSFPPTPSFLGVAVAVIPPAIHPMSKGS